MFRFWFRFVPRGINAIERGFGRQYFENAVRPFLHEYMGPVFETICQDYTALRGMTGRYGFLVTRIGKWRGSDPVKKEPTDIDVVGISDIDKKAVIGECKFKNEIVGRQEYQTLVDRARLVAPYHVKNICCFLCLDSLIGLQHMLLLILRWNFYLLMIYTMIINRGILI